ncbi:hypothetical protein WN873_01840 [Tetragenococcus halophilus]|uniref:hypothetical protein n=1 Tax=Tetragenococcus halophilus TaxID=51669 RepID=UPI0030F1D698
MGIFLKDITRASGGIFLVLLGLLFDQDKRKTVFPFAAFSLIVCLLSYLSLLIYNEMQKKNEEIKKLQEANKNLNKTTEELKENKKGLIESLNRYKKENKDLEQENQLQALALGEIKTYAKELTHTADESNIKKAEKAVKIDSLVNEGVNKNERQ